MRALASVGLGVLLLMPALLVAGAPEDALRQTVDQLLVVLKDPRLKEEGNQVERRRKLKELIYQRFDFMEMARRSLGPEWGRRSPEEQKDFVRLFTNLLETTYLDQIESYSGQKVRYLKGRVHANYAEVDTKVVDNKGQEFSFNYRLHNRDGDWKVYDVIIEQISLVNNYRAQFNRVLARSSFKDLLESMKQK
ncbi:MAG TPA: ABC transporter substrate-binding protein [Candidatus Binatia bacterium]|nr:ABC transporter substrate-binding protein [Candidatus Binatia bacterium]